SAPQAVLAREALSRAVVALEPEPRVGRLDDVDRVRVLVQQHGGGRRVEMVEGMRDVDEAALSADALDRLGERQAARHLLVEEEPDDLTVARSLDLRADDDVQWQATLDRTRAGLGAAGYRVVISDGDRAEARCEGGVEQLVDGRRAIPRVLAVHVQVGQQGAGSRIHAVTDSRTRPGSRPRA